MDKPLLVSLNGKLFDISGFVKKHPGGEKVLLKAAGEDIKRFMDGTERILSVKHQHSEAAYNILQRYSIDQTYEVI